MICYVYFHTRDNNKTILLSRQSGELWVCYSEIKIPLLFFILFRYSTIFEQQFYRYLISDKYGARSSGVYFIDLKNQNDRLRLRGIRPDILPQGTYVIIYFVRNMELSADFII